MRVKFWVLFAVLWSAFGVRAATNVFEMPLIYPKHLQLLQQMAQAARAGKIDDMEAACRSGVELLPQDPTWQYNLACALAYRATKDEALVALERAIDLGFRNDEAIAADKGGQGLLATAQVGRDGGVIDANDTEAFIAAAKTRQWEREKSVRTLA